MYPCSRVRGTTKDERSVSAVTQIAGIVFSICSERPSDGATLGGTCKQFACDVQPEITLHVHSGGVPQVSLQDGDEVFESGSSWSLYRTKGGNVLVQRSPIFGSVPHRIAEFDSDFRQGEVYSRVPDPQRGQDDPLSTALGCPLAEVLIICLLARGRGLMVHGCGVNDDGKGYLFAGKSTHGKTTMARLWKEQALILNDDRIVLRWSDGRFWMYGAPWHGDYASVSTEPLPLQRIFFLRHAESNDVERKGRATASCMLLTRCFPPLWDAEGMRFTLDFCARLVEAVPCYELGFMPNDSIVELVRSVD